MQLILAMMFIISHILTLYITGCQGRVWLPGHVRELSTRSERCGHCYTTDHRDCTNSLHAKGREDASSFNPCFFVDLREFKAALNMNVVLHLY